MTTSSYSMFLTFDGGKVILPIAVLPEKIEVRSGTNLDSVNIAGLGEIVVRQGRPALTITFSSFFPATKFHGISQADIQDPYKVVELINSKMENKEITCFVSTACALNLYVIIESFEYEERGGDVKTIYYTMRLREYREVQTRQISISNQGYTPQYSDSQLITYAPPTTYIDTRPAEEQNDFVPDSTGIRRFSFARVDNSQIPDTYTVQNCESLFDIAGKVYGNPDKMYDILNANYGKLNGSMNNVKNGMVLVIPK